MFYFEGYDQGVNGCDVSRCTEVITDLPNPLMWWACSLSMLLLILWWIGARDWRAGAILGRRRRLPALADVPERTMYFFYTLPMVPAMVLALTYMIGKFISSDPRRGAATRPRVAAVSVFLAVLLLVSALFWPIWSGELIDDEYWRALRWIPNWG